MNIDNNAPSNSSDLMLVQHLIPTLRPSVIRFAFYRSNGL